MRRSSVAITAAVCLLGVGTSLAAQSAPPSGATGGISGTVVINGTGIPLSYSIVSIPTQQLERSVDVHGHLDLSGVAPGSVTIHVKHIGYTPNDVIVVVKAGAITVVQIPMTRLAVDLDPVRATAHPVCTRPGRPTEGAERTLVALFEEAMRNADSNWVGMHQRGHLSAVIVERSVGARLANGSTLAAQSASLVSQFSGNLPYASGQVISALHRGTITSQIWRGGPGSIVDPGPPIFFNLTIPGPAALTDRAFVASHCFWYGGPTVVENDTLIRVDFDADQRIQDPDIAGTLYLDAHSDVVRRSVMRLTRIPTVLDGLRALTVSSTFSDLPLGVHLVDRSASILSAPDTTNSIGIDQLDSQRMILAIYLPRH